MRRHIGGSLCATTLARTGKFRPLTQRNIPKKKHPPASATRMKIILLSMNFAPELTGIGKYSGEMADELVRRGHEVTVVCAPPYYPKWDLSAGYSNQAYTREQP